MIENYPANICWSSRRLQHVFKTCLEFFVFQDVFKTSWRCLEDVLQIHLEDVLKTSWRHLARRLEDVLEDKKLLRWRRLEDMSWRRLGDKQNVYWGYVFNHGLPANLNQYLTNLYLINLYFSNLRRIRNALIRTQ